MNHPFKTNTGSVGTPIAGVEVKIAEDGEILVRGENVTTGYYEPADGSRQTADAGRETGVADSRLPTPDSREGSRLRDAEGWLHTGDIGELDAQGRLFIRGRKKEMIVTPEGLNVFPDDVERALEGQAGVVESAVVGHREAGRTEERVHAVLVLEPDIDPERGGRLGQRAAGRSSARARFLAVDHRTAAAHRRHAQAEARGDPAVGGCGRQPRAAPISGDAIAIRARTIRRGPGQLRRAHRSRGWA